MRRGTDQPRSISAWGREQTSSLPPITQANRPAPRKPWVGSGQFKSSQWCQEFQALGQASVARSAVADIDLLPTRIGSGHRHSSDSKNLLILRRSSRSSIALASPKRASANPVCLLRPIAPPRSGRGRQSSSRRYAKVMHPAQQGFWQGHVDPPGRQPATIGQGKDRRRPRMLRALP